MTLFALLFAHTASAAEPTLHEHMAEHLNATTQARDAVIRGDFDGARTQLRALAEHEPLTGVPPEVQGFVDAMQRAAKKGAKAKSIEDAGAAIGQVSLQCGACHQALGKGPDFGALAPPEDGDDAKAHMQRHAWATSRMWEGLVMPARERWDAGALHLLEDPFVKGGTQTPDLDPEVARLGQRVHRAGMDALLTWSESERAGLYGSLIATCARCHRSADDGSAKP